MGEEKKKVYGIKRDIVFMYIAIIVTGLLFFIFPTASTLTITYILAGGIMLLGIAKLLGYFKTSRMNIFGSYGLVHGSLLVLFAGWIMIRPEFFSGLVLTAAGVIIIADGIFKVQYAVDLLRIKVEIWIGVLITAILMIVAGVVAVMNPFATAVALMRFTGLFMILNGIVDIAVIVFISKKLTSIRKAMENGEFYCDFID